MLKILNAGNRIMNILFVALTIMMYFYKLDKLMPQIKTDLEARNISIDN